MDNRICRLQFQMCYEKQLIAFQLFSLSKGEQQVFLQNTFEKYFKIFGKVLISTFPKIVLMYYWLQYGKITSRQKQFQFPEYTKTTLVKLNSQQKLNFPSHRIQLIDKNLYHVKCYLSIFLKVKYQVSLSASINDINNEVYCFSWCYYCCFP